MSLKSLFLIVFVFFASSPAVYADSVEEKENPVMSGLRNAGGFIARGASAVFHAPEKAMGAMRNREKPEAPVYLKLDEEIFDVYRDFFGRDLKFRQVEWPSGDNKEGAFSDLPGDVRGKPVLFRAPDGENKETTIFIITNSRHWEDAPEELKEFTVTAEEFWRLLRQFSDSRTNSTAAPV